MDNAGWIKLHRSIVYHWIWSSSKHFQRWVDMLFMASWTQKKVIYNTKQVTLKRGQFATSNRDLQRRWGTNAKGVILFLSTLSCDGMIKVEKNKFMTIITICNYDKFQPLFFNGNDAEIGAESHDENILVLDDNGQRKRQHNIKNIKNKINNSLSLSRENSEKIFEEVKGNDKFWEDCCRSLSSDRAVVESLLNAFYSAKVDTDEFPDSYSKFKTYFLNWARTQINNKSNGAKQKTGNSAPEDKYSTRRGTDPGSLGKQDFNSDF